MKTPSVCFVQCLEAGCGEIGDAGPIGKCEFCGSRQIRALPPPNARADNSDLYLRLASALESAINLIEDEIELDAAPLHGVRTSRALIAFARQGLTPLPPPSEQETFGTVCEICGGESWLGALCVECRAVGDIAAHGGSMAP